MVFQRLSSSFSKPPRSTCWPIAAMTVSTAIISSSPVGSGRLRPEASASPNCIFCILMAATRPSSSIISSGARRNLKIIPSSSASTISLSSAGISARLRRYSTITSAAPSLIAVRAASMAVLPPPIIAILSPINTGSREATARKNSIPPTTPLVSSPAQPIFEDTQAPIPRKTAS